MDNLDFLTKEENEARNKFLEKFNIEKINEIKDDELPYTIYGNKEHDSMAYNIEFMLNNDFGNMSGTAKNITYPIYLKKEDNTWKKENSIIQFEEATRISIETKDSINLIDNLIKNNKFDDLFKFLNNKKHIFEFRLMHKYLCVVYPTLFLHWHIKEKFKEYMKILKLDDYNNIFVVEKYFWDKYKNNIENLNMKEETKKLEQQLIEKYQGDNMEKISYLDSIIKAIKQLGGQAPLLKIYNEVRYIRSEANQKINDSHEATIRGVIETHSSDSKKWTKKEKDNIFKKVEEGIWTLREGIFKDEDIINDNVNENINVSESNIDDKIINQPLNQILYGPPGTGKTYNTVIKAMEIINKNKIKYDDNNNILNYKELEEEFDKLKQSGQIEFITFHQSYSYEEFIEGIKPDIKEWETENKDITYIGKDGILKDISNSAKSELIKNIAKNNIDLEKINIFKMSLGNTKDDNDTNIFEYCIKNNVVAIGYGNDINFSECKSENDLEKFLNQQENNDNKKSIISRMNVFRFVLKNDDLILVSNGNKNIRAIAQVEGEYFFNDKTEINYNHFRKVKWLYNGENISTNTMLNEKQLSQTSIYKFNKEDINFTFLNQILNPSKDYKPKPYILIIDEINRGNISKIFGEMITLIEEDKRIGNEHELKLTLPYSKEPFGIPNNLYIIGTMNTSDRSIASVDIALRRRFKFIEMMPKSDLVTDILIKDENKSISFKYIFEALNEKITILLDRDHQIGHSYFLKEKINSIYDLQSIWFDEILPLLNEYFYNDWYKLQALLGEAELKKDNNEKNSSFIVKSDLSKYKMKDIDKEDKFIFNFVDRDKVNFQQALLKIIELVKNNAENKEINSDEQENN